MYHTNFTSITLRTESSFYKSASVYLDSMQILYVLFDDVKFNKIVHKTPAKIFLT